MTRQHSPLQLRHLALAWVALTSCADVGLGPSVPASIELASLASPALVVGDTLRDIDGKAIPIAAVVRNQQGEILPDVVVRYTYADFARDSALTVDSLLGYVISQKALKGSGTTARIAARAGSNLQVIRTVLVTTRPDSVDRLEAPAIDTLRVAPGTSEAAKRANTSGALQVTVKHAEGTPTVVTRVPNWLVKFELIYPANPTNDSTKSAFLVNELHKLSNIDTTDLSGAASRLVRIRAEQFPSGVEPDSAVVSVIVTYRGTPVRNAPLRIKVPVIKKP